MGRCDLCLEGSLHLGQRRVFVEGGAAEPDRLRRAREQSRSGGHQHRVERDGASAPGGPVSPRPVPCSTLQLLLPSRLPAALIRRDLIFYLPPSSTITTPSYCLIGGVIYERARKLLLLVALAVLAATDAHEHLPCGGNQHQLAQHGCDSSSAWRAGTRPKRMQTRVVPLIRRGGMGSHLAGVLATAQQACIVERVVYEARRGELVLCAQDTR